MEKGFLIKSINIGGSDIKYVVYVPPAYQPDRPIPLIVFLNGQGECGSDGLNQIRVGLGPAIMQHVDDWPFIVLFPQKQIERGVWEAEDPMVVAELNATFAELNIDRSRIYLTGLSQGGHGTWAIGAMHPDLFAAIAPICGWGDEQIAEKLVDMPIRLFHGDQDRAVTVDQSYNMKSWLEAHGGSCELTIYEGVGHDSWTRAYREENLPQWFLQHKRSS